MKTARLIELSDEQHIKLEEMVRSQTLEVRAVRRAQIVLSAADGMGNREIAAALGIGRVQVGRWRERFIQGGVVAIEGDLPRSERKPRVDRAEIVRLRTQTTPEAATHWSTRTLAEKAGVSDTTVLRIWQANGLKPHLVDGFKVSRDSKFVEKLEDIVGLYMSPPEHALVLCCDEKSQVQALDRTQPGLPLKRGRAATQTHDYKRHGTATLFAALNTLDGSVIARCDQRHRHSEWLDFLRQIERETPKGKELHLICDNYATHKRPKVKEWLAKHPRFTVHFVMKLCQRRHKTLLLWCWQQRMHVRPGRCWCETSATRLTMWMVYYRATNRLDQSNGITPRICRIDTAGHRLQFEL